MVANRVVQGRDKAARKEEKKVEKVLKEDRKEEKALVRQQGRQAGVPIVGGSRAQQARMHKQVSIAQFLSCLFNPFDCPSRMPDKMSMLNTVVLPFRQTGTITSTSPFPGAWYIELSPVLQEMWFTRTGTVAWGSTSISDPAYLMLSAASSLSGFVLSARCVGLKVRVEYASAFTATQGVVTAAIVPPGASNGAVTAATLSQYPNSAVSTATSIAAQGCFEFVWLPQRSAGNYDAALAEGAYLNAPYDPQQFIPFNGDTHGITGAMPFIAIRSDGNTANAVYMVTVEACFECDCVCGGLLGSDVRPPEEAFDVMEDLAEPLFESQVGVQPMTVASQKSALAPQQQIMQASIAGAPAVMSEPTAEFLDSAESVLSKAGDKAWDLVKEYGPDALETVVGLLPGGSLATTAAKVGGMLGKWLL